MMTIRHLLAMVLLSVGLAAPAAAQGFIKKIARTGLTQDDINIMVETASDLYASGGAVVGADTVWLNPETDAHGLAEITEVAGNCVRIAYRFRTTRRPSLQTVEALRCLENGRWVLSG